MFRQSSTYLLLAFLLQAATLSAQPLDDLIIFPQSNQYVFVAEGDEIYRIDIDSGNIAFFASFPDDSLFASNTTPQHNSGVVAERGLWLWDSSIGSVVQIDSSGVTTTYPRDAGPTFSRFSHVSTTHPVNNQPLVFGGYGFYRAQDFFLYFDPVLGEWGELPSTYGTDDPSPRQRGRLLNAHNGKDIFLIGGTVSETRNTPQYDVPEFDKAWDFDVETGLWDLLPINLAVACALMDPPVWISDSESGTPTYLSVFSQQQLTGCLAEDIDGLEKGSVILWNPKEHQWAKLTTTFQFNANHRLAAVSVSDDSIRIHQVGLAPEENPPLRLVKRSMAMPDALNWQNLSYPTDPFSIWKWSLVIAFILGLMLWISWRLNVRTAVMLVPSLNEIRIQRGMIEARVGLTPNAVELLSHMARQPVDAVFSREQLEEPFSDRHYESDTLRTVTNRAVTALNDFGQKEFGEDLVVRSSAADDKRRQEYSLSFPIRIRD